MSTIEKWNKFLKRHKLFELWEKLEDLQIKELLSDEFKKVGIKMCSSCGNISLGNKKIEKKCYHCNSKSNTIIFKYKEIKRENIKDSLTFTCNRTLTNLSGRGTGYHFIALTKNLILGKKGNIKDFVGNYREYEVNKKPIIPDKKYLFYKREYSVGYGKTNYEPDKIYVIHRI